jgi:hypothetical protein
MKYCARCFSAQVFVFLGSFIPAQQFPLYIDVRADGRPVAGTRVTVAGTSLVADASGRVIATVSRGMVLIESLMTVF